MTFIESNWTYDKLGRVVSQVVQKGPGPVQVARQDLTYLGNDDPSTLAHSIGASSKQFQFGFDRRHQITSANELTTPGYFSSTYGYGVAGRFASANLAQSSPPFGSELTPRSVNYQYADPDPERVTALVNATTLLTVSSYRYDEAGNQTLRCNGAIATTCLGESVEFVYDGKDQLRRAVKKSIAGFVQGSEEYWYDGDGVRSAVVKRDANGTKTETVVFLEELEAHYDQADVHYMSYAHLSLGTPIGRVKRTAAGPEIEYQFHGLANHTLAAVSSTGATNAAFSYSPYGEVLETIDAGNGSGTEVHQRRFGDKHHDTMTELTYFGARYYDAKLISWTQSDPVYRFIPETAWFQPRRSLLYVALLNNPLRYLDPDGRDATITAPPFTTPTVNTNARPVSGPQVVVVIVVAVFSYAWNANSEPQDPSVGTGCGSYCPQSPTPAWIANVTRAAQAGRTWGTPPPLKPRDTGTTVSPQALSWIDESNRTGA